MSGNFTQRCEPAIAEKRIRAKAALLSGVDLVVELPLPYATATAQKFAYGGTFLLKATGVVDTLLFGSELGQHEKLEQIADVLQTEEFSGRLAVHLEEGMTFARARGKAVGDILGERAEKIIATPNNILAIEYISEAKKQGWNPKYMTIPRKGVAHDSKTAKDSFASASYLRQAGENWAELCKFMPEKAVEVYRQAFKAEVYPCDKAKLDIAVTSYLRRLDTESLKSLPDISEGIENRLHYAIAGSTNMKEIAEGLKTKRYTMARVRRLILSAFLGITAQDIATPPPYIRVLGFNDKGRELLGKMKDSASIPFGHSLRELENKGGSFERFARLEAKSTDQFTLTQAKPAPCGYDYTAPGVFL